jgi:ABC-2 type transport system permease protein
MRSVLALTKRILQQFSHDPRTVALFIVAPCLALWLFSVLLTGSDYRPSIAAVDVSPDVVQALRDQNADVIEYDTDDSGVAEDLLASQEIDAIITQDDGTLVVKVEGTDTSKTSATMSVVQAAMRQVVDGKREAVLATFDELKETVQAKLEHLGIPIEFPELDFVVTDVEITFLHGDDSWTYFDFFGPVFIGIFVFVFVFITSGMSLVTERTGGTMERLLTTPIRSWQLVAGYSLGFGLVSLIQACIVLFVCIFLIGFPNAGSLGLVVLVTFSMALVSLTLGLLVSALAKTALQVIQLMILLVVPQVLLSGIFDLSQAPTWMQVLSACFPISYGADALRDLMLRGVGFADVALNFAVLWGFIAVFFLLATLSFSLQRKR